MKKVMGKVKCWNLITSATVAAVVWMVLIQLLVRYEYDHGNVIHFALATGKALLTTGTLYISLLWLFALFVLFETLFNRIVWGLLSASLVVAIFWIASYFKWQLRNEPIYGSDLSEIKSIGELINMVDFATLLAMFGLLVVIVVLVLVTMTLLQRKTKKNGIQNTTHRIVKAKFARFGIILISTLVVVTPFVAPKGTLEGVYHDLGFVQSGWSVREDAIKNGPLLTLFQSQNAELIKKPLNYSKASMLKLAEKYDTNAKFINQNRGKKFFKGQTVLYVLSESLTNPNKVRGLTLKQNPMKNISEIMDTKAGISGSMVSSNFGGGTANIEYMTLTGIPLAAYAPAMTVPYTQLPGNPKITRIPSIADWFDDLMTVHPYIGEFYNRSTMYRLMGIDKFITTDSKYKNDFVAKNKLGKSEYIDDQSAYDDTLALINNKENNDSQFIQLITMQNHAPYEKGEYTNEFSDFKLEKKYEKNLSGVSAYLTGVQATDEATYNFINKLEKLDRPVSLVFYGDHWPVAFDFVNRNSTKSTAYETPYFIWQNSAAKKTASSILSRGELTAPNEFNAQLLEKLSVNTNGYMALQTLISDNLPPIANYIRSSSGNLNFVDQRSNDVFDQRKLTKKQRALISDLRMVMYDISSGKGYLYETPFFNINK